MQNMKQQQWIVLGFTALLLWAALGVLGPFLPSAFWAGVLVICTWGGYQKIRSLVTKNDLGSALLMTGLVTLGVIVPVSALAFVLSQDARRLYTNLQKVDLAPLAEQAAQIPLVGSQLQTWLQLDSAQAQALVLSQSQRLLSILGGGVSEVGGALVTLGLALFTAFFLYLQGEALAQKIIRSLDLLGGETLTSLVPTVVTTVQSVVLGLMLTAAAQGVLAALGLWAAGIQGAIVLGFMVTLIAIVQVPTPLVWFPCVVWLFIQGATLPAVGLFLWGALVVSTIDNFLKPIFISQGTGLPFVLVFFGVLGGLLAFGTVGIVLGPVIFSLLLTLWQRWSAIPD